MKKQIRLIPPPPLAAWHNYAILLGLRVCVCVCGKGMSEGGKTAEST